MSETYSIQNETLVAIGDALRRRHGETKIITVEGYLPYFISKTPNATGPDSHDGEYEKNARIYNVVHIPGAVRIEVDLYYQGESVNYDWVQVAPGELNESTFPTTATKYSGSTEIGNTQLTFDTDTITFFFRSDSSTSNFLGYYAICQGYDDGGNVILSDELSEWEEEVINDYSPLEMPQAIDDIFTGIVPPESALTITGGVKGMFANGTWDWFIEQMGDQITTTHLLNIEEMFRNSKVKKIPFAINRTSNDSEAGNNSCSYVFQQCYELEELPDITGKLSNCYMFLSQCRKIKEIPESWANIDWSYINKQTSYSYARLGNFFDRCLGLRKIPESVLKQIYNKCASNGCDSMFSYCYSLDEIVGLRGPNNSTGSNVFSNMFSYCQRLKRLVFDMDNGQPRVCDWSYQTLDMTYYVGYANGSNSYNTSEMLLYSGITTDKEVKDDATYQALKNDPDWFATKIEYSRYNHDSAVETINSLPDCSQRGTTNTIKFKGSAGSLTDGGAINTMTAEEIAVATAKGWTVSFS